MKCWLPAIAMLAINLACARSGYEPIGGVAVLSQTLTRVDQTGHHYSSEPVVRWGGRCNVGATVRVSSVVETRDIDCSTGNWAYATELVDDGLVGFAIVQTSAQHRTARVDVSWTLDRAAPSVTLLATNDGDTVRHSWVTASIEASDALSPIIDLCFKYNATAGPANSDTCWHALDALVPATTPASRVTVSNTRVLIGLSPGLYRANAWVRDAAGNVSQLSGGIAGTIGVDRIDVLYTPGKPPDLDKVLVTGVAQPNEPPTASELTIAAGGDVYVRWTVSDDTPIPEDSISLSYSTNDETWTEIATGLNNGPADPDCRRGVQGTGCYTWRGGAPTSEFFRVKVTVRDSDNLATVIESQPLNTRNLSIVAGDTSSGIGGSGFGVVFANASSLGDQRIGDPSWFTVASNRDIYVRDRARGVLRTDSATGSVEVFLPLAANPIGDGVPVTEAAVREPVAIAAGFDDDLFIFDFDIIRRVDLASSPPTITTVIGGGANTQDTVAARDLYIEHQLVGWKHAALVPLPDGRVVFRSENPDGGVPQRLRVYDPSSGTVSSVVMRGIGVGNNPSQDISTCLLEWWGISFTQEIPTPFEVVAMVAQQPASVNPSCSSGVSFFTHTALRLDNSGQSSGLSQAVTGALVGDALATGSNGKVYKINRVSGTIESADLTSNTWVRVLGNGSTSLCADGAPAGSCGASPEDLFADGDGHVYFAELGVIRVVGDDGGVYSLAGQSLDAGDGRGAHSARFGALTSIDRYRNADTLTIQALDTQAVRIREFPLDGAITTIAGTGISAPPVLGMPAATEPIDIGTVQNPIPIILTESDGKVLYRRGLTITELNRTSGVWSTVVGGGATSYRTGDGQAGTTIALTGTQAAVSPWGFNGTTMLLSPLAFTTDFVSYSDPMIKRYTAGSWVQAPLVTYTGAPPQAWCALGTSLAACATPLTLMANLQRAAFDPIDGAWIVSTTSTAFYRLVAGGTLAQAFTLPARSVAFEYRRDSSSTDVWYCTSSGELHSYEPSSGTDVVIDLLAPSLRCSGKSMFYDAVSDALFFIVRSTSGLTAIARYQSP